MSTVADTPTLAKIVERCFDLSMDGRLSDARRRGYLALGKRLRGSLLNLLSARFDDGAPKLKAANDQLARINASLKKASDAIEDAAETLKQLANLAKNLDDLLRIAAAFV